MLLLSLSWDNSKYLMMENLEIYVLLNLDMYELVKETTSKNAEHDPLKYHLYVLDHDPMYTK